MTRTGLSSRVPRIQISSTSTGLRREQRADGVQTVDQIILHDGVFSPVYRRVFFFVAASRGASVG